MVQIRVAYQIFYIQKLKEFIKNVVRIVDHATLHLQISLYINLWERTNEY